jgi:peptide/nickel transport system permease protein
MLLLLKPIFFATDIMLFIFSAITLLWAYKIKTKHNIYKQWEPLFKNKIYSSCFVVLSFFYGIALLDSFHFKIPVENQNNNEVYSNHVNSIFDKLVSPLGTVEEQTYSKPFATTNLNKNYIKQKNGSYESFYKPLKLTANSSNYSFSSILFECVKNISLLLLVMAIYVILKQKLWRKSKIKLISFKPSSMMFTFIICCSTLITISYYFTILPYIWHQ